MRVGAAAAYAGVVAAYAGAAAAYAGAATAYAVTAKIRLTQPQVELEGWAEVLISPQTNLVLKSCHNYSSIFKYSIFKYQSF